MIKSIINAENTAEADVVIVSAPYEKTASSHKGTAAGPAKVVDMLENQIEFFDRKFKKEVIDFVKTAHVQLDVQNLPPEDNLKTIRENCEKLVAQNKFVFLLGGEHSVSIGLFQALAKKYSPKDVTILQIDAHCDLRRDDSDYNEKPSNLAHSTVMRHASELGYNLAQVGIRSFSTDEYNYFNDPKNNVTVFEWNKDAVPVEKIIESIKTKYLYITIDVDGFDPAYMPGTGTPVPGGLSWYYGVDLIERAIAKSELISADIVEVSPQKETVITEYSAAQLAYTIIANKFSKKLN
ncbi:MAG TPA: agmatinase [Candidatus Paceibacterota bacterium]